VQDIQRATAAIGRELAWDLTYLSPAEQRRFDPVSIAEGAAAFLMMAYLRGFIDQISGRATKLGERTADFLLDRIGALFRGDPPPTPDELSAVADQARDAARKDQEGTGKALTATETQIVGYLLSRHMPEDTARAIAAMVRTQTEIEPDHGAVKPGYRQPKDI
jgi:hypothetical protein